MQHVNFICFDCRGVRRASRRAQPRCPGCRLPMSCVGLICPPPKRAVAAWEAWRRRCQAQHKALLDIGAKVQVRKQTQLRNYELLVEHRDVETRAGRRKYRQASRAYDQLVT